MAIVKSWYCAYDVHYHIMFPVKYGKALLRPDIEHEFIRIANEMHERYEIEFEAIGADRIHIHLLCSAYPKIDIVVGML